MVKIGCLKPFRGTTSSLANIVLEDGEIAFATDTSAIYMGNGVDTISALTPFINAGTTDISSIGDGSITSAISTINSNWKLVGAYHASVTGDFGFNFIRPDGNQASLWISSSVVTSYGGFIEI